LESIRKTGIGIEKKKYELEDWNWICFTKHELELI
jgi:hypothetical protein